MNAQTLVEYFSGLHYEQVPEDAMQETKRMVLDTLGCIVSARGTEAGRIAERFAGLLGGASGIAGSAYVYGRLADAMDFNEGYGGAHFGCGAVAAALALAREPGITGKEFLTAVAAGYELGGRIQDAMGPYYSVVDGRQSFSPVWGIATPIVYAAVGAAARALRLDHALTAQAWGLAGSNSPIPVGAKWSSSIDLPNTKYCDAGWCSLAGVTGALSAQFGSTGITTLLDDPGGLLRMVSSLHPAHALLFAGLGTRWRIRDVVYKTWPCCGLLDEPMDDLLSLMQEQPFDVETIERIEVEVGSAIVIPRFVNTDPRTFASLQFNLPHALAMLLLKVPPGPEWLSADLARDPRVAALRAKVIVREHRDPWPAPGQRKPSSVRVITKNGDRPRFSGNRGQTSKRWGDDEIVDKFRSLVAPDDDRSIIDTVMSLETLDSPAPLLDALQRAKPRH